MMERCEEKTFGAAVMSGPIFRMDYVIVALTNVYAKFSVPDSWAMITV